MYVNVMNRNNIIKIQRYYRVYSLKKKLIKLKEFKLCKTKNFGELSVLLKNKKVIEQMSLVLNSFDKFSCIPLNTKPQVILLAYIVQKFPVDVIGHNKDRHPIDKELLKNSIKIVSLLENFDELNYYTCVSINKFIKNFCELFTFWKNMDKNRTIQNIIISYHNRREHLEYLEKEEMNEDQKNKMKNSLNNECKVLVSQIKTIDANFDIEYKYLMHVPLKALYKDYIDYFKFTVVRNPIYRCISAYYYIKRLREKTIQKKTSLIVIEKTLHPFPSEEFKTDRKVS